jgi:membrane protein
LTDEERRGAELSSQSHKVKQIRRRVAKIREHELKTRSVWERRFDTVQRWLWMLYHEYLKDEVQIRAQSLAFLMIFSLLPLIAGAFFVFTFFAQFGMVQDALQGMVSQFLGTIPPVHRDFINEYILHFKDAYLANLTQTSSSVGVFALLILAWVGLQTFNNVDATLNYIWSADRSRPFYEKARNFIVVAVVAPLVLTAGFSVPIILQKFSVTRFFLERFTILSVLLNFVIPSVLVLGIFLMMYRFIPVRRVWWRSAFYGALFSTSMLAMVNLVMRIYFAVGTNSAYGKAAAVPLIGFWIYALWIVVILGAEVSFLIQNGHDIFVAPEREPSLKEGRGLLSILVHLYRAYLKGSGPARFETLREVSGLDSAKTRHCLQYLSRQNWVVECAERPELAVGEYVLARDPSTLALDALLIDYFCFSESETTGPLDKQWDKGLDHWVGFFKKTSLADLAK